MLAEYLENTTDSICIFVRDDIYCSTNNSGSFNINELPVLIDLFPKINLYKLYTNNIDLLHAIKPYKIREMELTEINLDLVDLVNYNFDNINCLCLTKCSSTKTINFNVDKLYIFDSCVNIDLTNCNLIRLNILNSQCFSQCFNVIHTLYLLTELDVKCCKITEFPEVICNLVNLQSLNLSGNNISIIPENIGNLTNLHELNLCFNQIYKLPKNIYNLINLEKLWLPRNKLTKMPKLRRLPKLTSLILNQNCITEISGECLQNLKYFYIANNSITILLEEIKFVKVTDFRDNPIFVQCQKLYKRTTHDDLIKFSELKRLILYTAAYLGIVHNTGRNVIHSVCIAMQVHSVHSLV